MRKTRHLITPNDRKAPLTVKICCFQWIHDGWLIPLSCCLSKRPKLKFCVTAKASFPAKAAIRIFVLKFTDCHWSITFTFRTNIKGLVVSFLLWLPKSDFSHVLSHRESSVCWGGYDHPHHGGCIRTDGVGKKGWEWKLRVGSNMILVLVISHLPTGSHTLDTDLNTSRQLDGGRWNSCWKLSLNSVYPWARNLNINLDHSSIPRELKPGRENSFFFFRRN